MLLKKKGFFLLTVSWHQGKPCVRMTKEKNSVIRRDIYILLSFAAQLICRLRDFFFSFQASVKISGWEHFNSVEWQHLIALEVRVFLSLYTSILKFSVIYFIRIFLIESLGRLYVLYISSTVNACLFESWMKIEMSVYHFSQLWICISILENVYNRGGKYSGPVLCLKGVACIAY